MRAPNDCRGYLTKLPQDTLVISFPGSGSYELPTFGFLEGTRFDDLPTHGNMPQGSSRIEIARQMLATLKKHKIQEAYGFINAEKVEKNPEFLEVLTEWVKAEYPLGNHTFSHKIWRKILLMNLKVKSLKMEHCFRSS